MNFNNLLIHVANFVIVITLHCIKLHAGNEFLCWFTATFDAGGKCLLVSLIEVFFLGERG